MGIFDRKTITPKTFADALMGEQFWHTEIPETEIPQQLTEKAVILESFTQFVEEKLDENQSESVSFPGGEVVRKEDPTQLPLRPIFRSLEEWNKAQLAINGAQTWEMLTKSKNEHPLVLFIGETLVSLETFSNEVLPEFQVCFPVGVAELFQKMVQAMKLSPGEYVLTTLKTLETEKTPEQLFEEAYWWKPRFVVPLGAQACQAFLGPRERLASVHGKAFSLPRLPNGTEIVPLFHPSVIATNANMKKSTWTDMQKIMKVLGKV